MSAAPRPPAAPSCRRATGSRRSPRARSPSRPSSRTSAPRPTTAIASAPPEPPSPITDRHDRHPEPRHLAQVDRDRLGLAALLGAEPRVGAGRVDQRHDRHAGSGRRAASAAAPCGSPRGSACRSGAAGSPWCRAPSAGRSPSPGASSSSASPPTIAGSSPKWRSPCSSVKSVKHALDVVERVGPARMARELDPLVGGQARVDLAAQLRRPCARAPRARRSRRARAPARWSRSSWIFCSSSSTGFSKSSQAVMAPPCPSGPGAREGARASAAEHRRRPRPPGTGATASPSRE